MILDSTVLVDMLRGTPPAVKLMRELDGSSEAVRIPTVVIFELWEGAERSKRPAAEREAVEEVVSSYEVIPLRLEHAKRAGIISASLSDRGDRIGDADFLIAGTALEEGDVLVTRNKRDFERVPGLRLRTY